MIVFLNEKGAKKNVRGWTFLTVRLGFGFRERERVPLLSKITGDPTVGSFRKTVLHIVDYTWAPVSGVFDKLREVGVLLSHPTFIGCNRR